MRRIASPARFKSIETAFASPAGEQRARFADYAHERFRWEAAIESWQAALLRAAGSKP